MADWNEPSNISLMDEVLGNLKDRDENAGTLFLNAPTNPIVGMVRWHRASSKFQEYNGSSWIDMVLSIAGGGSAAITASAARTSLGLGSLATQNSNAVTISGGSISGLTSLGVSGTVTAGLFAGDGTSITNIPNAATTATNLNAAGAIVARDGAGNFSAGTITATFNGLVTNGVVTSGSYADPAWITSLSATKLTLGTLPDARLTGNIPRKDSSVNIFTGFQTCSGQPAGKGYRSTDVPIATGVETFLQFDSTLYNRAASTIIAVNQNNSFTNGGFATSDGVYLITYQVTFLAGGGTVRKLLIYDVLGNIVGRDERAPTGIPVVLRVTVQLDTATQGGTLAAKVYQDSGGNLDVFGFDQSNSYIEAVKLW